MPTMAGMPDSGDLFPAGLPSGVVERAVVFTTMQACMPASWAQVLDWAALLQYPVAATSVVAERYGRSPRNLRGRLQVVRRASAAAVLPLPVWSEASRQSRADEDHQARVRWAWLLHCPPPPPPSSAIGPVLAVTLAEQRMARQAAEILAAVGQLSAATLTVGVQRVQSRWHRHIESERLVTLLAHTGFAELQDNGLLVAADTIKPRPAHTALQAAARASGRHRHSTAQIQQLMLAAGYTRPVGTTLYNHPLLSHLGQDQWEILGRLPESGWPPTSEPTGTPARAS